MSKEIWKPLKEYKGVDYMGFYEVSNMGRVKSLDRMIHVKKRGGFEQFYNGKILRQRRCKKGYKYVALCKDGSPMGAKVNILVAICFLRMPKKGEVVHHKNSTPSDNRINNLSIITKRENESIEKTLASGLPVGVSLNEWGYSAFIKIKSINGKKSIYLGTYISIDEASNAYSTILDRHISGTIPNKEILDKCLNVYRKSIGVKPIRRIKRY